MKLTLQRKNRVIIFTYVTILAIVLLGFILMIGVKTNSYEENLFEKFYLYFLIFQLYLFSTFLPLWQVRNSNNCNRIIGVLLFTLASLPHLIIVISLTKISSIYILLCIFIELIWGIAILSFKEFLNYRKIDEFYILIIMQVFIFTVMIISLIFLWYLYHYKNLVLTSLYDKRIPFIFYTNPLLTLTGIVKSQIGGTNYLGYKPIIWFSAFWITVILIINMSKKYLTSR